MMYECPKMFWPSSKYQLEGNLMLDEGAGNLTATNYNPGSQIVTPPTGKTT
mgnify:CR=1 FL=1